MARMVIKVGSNLLVNQRGVRKSYLIELVSKINKLLDGGHEVALVTSGAGASGKTYLGLDKSTNNLISKQALCAVGQVQLMNVYQNAFDFYQRKIAQILLTKDDFSDHKRYLNLRNTLIGLKGLGIVPIINENDTVAVDEIKFGDNDTLSAMFSICWSAEYLILMTSVDGVIDENGNLIKEYVQGTKIASIEGTTFGTGGITSKISAALMAAESGVEAYIINGKELNNIDLVCSSQNPGTKFTPSIQKKLSSRKSWLKYLSKSKGNLHINEGAYEALKKRKSLLPVGIVSVDGQFEKGDSVNVVFNRSIVAKGIVNYSSQEVKRIMGLKSSEIPEELFTYEEVIHADNIIIGGR